MLHDLSQSTRWRDLIERFECFHMRGPVADPDLELRGGVGGGGGGGGEGAVLFCLPCRLFFLL